MVRQDLKHLKWHLMNHKGLSEDEAQEHIRMVLEAEKIKIKKPKKKTFQEEFSKLLNPKGDRD